MFNLFTLLDFDVLFRIGAIGGVVGVMANADRSLSDPITRARRSTIRAAILDQALEEDDPPLGIAFSGGGIRSATLSLGIAQALARKDRLLDFDYMSTVSGGGYFGSFLGTLFLPDELKGATPQNPEDVGSAKFSEAAEIAQEALIIPPDETMVRKRNIRSPIYWLREHSRYLAPGGMSDMASGATYLARNWLAMIYVFCLPLLLLFCLTRAVAELIASGLPKVASVLVLLVAEQAKPNGFCQLLEQCHSSGGVPVALQISWIFILAAIALFGSIACGLAYWLTEVRVGKDGKSQFFCNIILTTTAALAILLLLWVCEKPFPPLGFLIIGGITLTLVSAIIAIITSWRLKNREKAAFVSEVRRVLTAASRMCNLAFLTLAALAVVDTLALWLANWIAKNHGIRWSVLLISVWPFIAVVLSKVPGWFGGGGSKFSGLIWKNIWNIALMAGVIMFSSLAILVDLAVHWLVSAGHPFLYPSENNLSWFQFREWDSSKGLMWVWLTGISLFLTVLTGYLTGFINLSSLHNLYASRLSRAYLGGANVRRLEKAGSSKITENDPHDYIAVDQYQGAAGKSWAPLHLINVTLNETRSLTGSQLLERDRKGVPMVFAPEGIFVNAGVENEGQPAFPWDTEVPGVHAGQGFEILSVGQLCAISGAAASSAMGSMTTLGGALALTYANVRLGYWWSAGKLVGSVGLLSTPFQTYSYLWKEMTASYDRRWPLWNISDGGHFDNSGTYELLRRRIPRIVVCDHGSDPSYRFEDLENLVRKAKLDLGLDVTVAASDDLADAGITQEASHLFLNGPDWREACKGKSGSAFALLLRVRNHDKPGESPFSGWIVWLKPVLIDGLSEDVRGYALSHDSFPQETTADQFFDEAQWESYRALGEAMMDKLLTVAGPDVFRRLGTAAA